MPLLGAAVFMLGGVATSRLQHVPQIWSYSLMPIQLLAFRAACRRPAASTVVLLATALAAGLANLNQVTFLSFWALLPFVVFHLWASNTPVRALISASGAGLAALVFASPVLSAVAEFLPLSNRATMSLADSSVFSFPLLNITSLLLAGLFGTMTPETGFWPPTDLSQDYLYIGLIPCLVLVAAVWRTPGALMPAPLCVSMTVLWFVFAMGTNTPVYPFLFEHVPGFSAFRRPADGAFLMNLSIALTIGSFRAGRLGMAGGRMRLLQVVVATCLAGLVAAASVALYRYADATGHRGELLPIVERVGRRALMIAAASGVALLVRLPSARRLIGPIIVIAVVGDMLAAGRFGPILSFAYTEGAVAQIYGKSANPVDYAVGIQQTIAFLRAHGAADRQNPTRIEVLGGALGGTMPLTERIAVTQGYNPLALGSYVKLIGHQNLSATAKTFTEAAPFYDSPLFRLLSVHYLLLDTYPSGQITTAIAAIARRLELGSWAKPVGVVGSYQVWEVRYVLPRATLHSANVAPVGADVGSCQTSSYKNVELVIDCRSTTPATLVVGDSYAPGWTACVNNKWQDVSAYAGLFRAVKLDRGESRIVMHYQAVPFLRSAERGNRCSLG